MSFKKKKINPNQEKKGTKIFSFIFGGIGMCIIFFAGVSSLAYVSDIDISGLKKIEKFYLEEIAPVTTIPIKNTVLKPRKEKNKVNILVVGRGGGDHDAPDLTDTIIVVSLDMEKDTVSMLSIPRDLYVEYGTNQKGKINRLYEGAYKRTESVVLAMEALEEKVEEITNEEIDYFVNLDFKGFVNLVDTVEGIEISVPETFIDYQYPDGNEGYTTFILRKGDWTLDGETALKYARSRYSTSDFDRSIRQQVIINALKDKMISLDYLTSPSKISALYETFQKDIQTDIPLRKIIPLAIKIQDIKKSDILTSNLNDTCFFGEEECRKGGFLYYPRKDLFGGTSVLLPEGSSNIEISEYEVLHEFTDYVFNKPRIFADQVKINIFNATKTNGLASQLAYDLIRFGFNIPPAGGTGNVENKTGEKSVILYNRLTKDDPTLTALQEKTKLEIQEVPFTEKSSDNDVKIEIILADDYLQAHGGI